MYIVKVDYTSSGIFHAVPAKTTQELHGPVYIQDQTRERIYKQTQNRLFVLFFVPNKKFQ